MLKTPGKSFRKMFGDMMMPGREEEIVRRTIVELRRTVEKADEEAASLVSLEVRGRMSHTLSRRARCLANARRKKLTRAIKAARKAGYSVPA